ncbi:MAG: hypothetical protein M1423_07075, partial [Acidobacteria bacterium]|nr:hypothetical protein [Acidobacteriota bacterium]
MKITQRMTVVALLALLAAGVVGLYLTAGLTTPASSSKGTASPAGVALSLNSNYLATARQLALTAATPAEQNAASDALDAADRELDLAYGYDLQLASREPVQETPRSQAI